jgi:hypothetical protein
MKNEVDIVKLCDSTRYSEDLAEACERLGGAENVQRLEFESDYQGFVDIDVLLLDGRVFSYYYSYGSCSGCDEWEDKSFSSEDVVKEILQEATLFDNQTQYFAWRDMVRKRDEERKKEFEYLANAQKQAEKKYQDALQKMFKKGELKDIGDYMRVNQKEHYYGG